jgi:hypothetical protein
LEASAINNTSGLIYIWSPNMTLSIKGLDEAVKVAKSLHVELIALLAPQSDAKAAQLIVKKEHVPLSSLHHFEADSLMRRDMLNHYPSFIVYSKGRLTARARLGYDTPERLAHFIREGMLQ